MSGGGSSILRSVAPMALMMIPGVGQALAPSLAAAGLGSGAAAAASGALMGGALNGGISALTGGNPLQAALMGAAGGGLGGYFGAQVPGADGAAGANPLDAAGATGMPDVARAANALDAPLVAGAPMQGPPMPLELAKAADPSTMAQIGSFIKENPLKSALIGSVGAMGIEELMGKKQGNKTDNNNGYEDELPEYTMETTETPYTGDWYTYGMQGQGPQIKRQLIRQPYAHGGAVNPLAFASKGRVPGKGSGGHADDVPALLSEDEYVLPAAVVSALGDGSSKAGARKLDKMVKNVRKHKTSKGSGFEPKAKNPLSYVGGA